MHLAKGSQAPKFPDDGKLRLYSMRFCPYAQRAHLVLDAKNIPYHATYINLKQKPEWFLSSKSPLGKVPALELPESPDEPLIESLVICDYLDEKYPENPLHSKDPLQRAKDKILIERFNAFISPFYRLMFSHTGAEGAPGAITDLNNALDIFEGELKKRGKKFYGGDKPGMVDYMIWPWCERTDAFAFILGDKYEMDKVRYAKLIDWKDAMKKDSAVKASLISGENHFKFRKSYLETPDNPDYDMLANNPAKKLRTN